MLVYNMQPMKRGIYIGMCGAVCAALAAGGAIPLAPLSASSAEAADTLYAAPAGGFDSAEHKTEIEILTDAYETARSVALVSDFKAAANQIRADALEAKIPEQQRRSDAAMRELYKMQQGRYGIIEMLLSSQTIDGFVDQAKYIESVSRENLETINELLDAKDRLEQAREKLEASRAESDAVMNMASMALDSAQAARAARQSAGQAGEGALSDDANWYQTEEEFVAEWAPRIDAYLAGSALDGQGAAFAQASWRYCVDPRWSPAIANTESSKGAYCIRPYNAWGWGAADSDPYGLASEWRSWEEAIDAHVRGLSEGYGYTISKAAAEKYCSSPDSWYEKTSSEMKSI